MEAQQIIDEVEKNGVMNEQDWEELKTKVEDKPKTWE